MEVTGSIDQPSNQYRLMHQVISDEYRANNISLAPLQITGDPGIKDDVILLSRSNAEQDNTSLDGHCHITNVKNPTAKQDLCIETLCGNGYDTLMRQRTVSKGDLAVQDSPRDNEAATINGHNAPSREKRLCGDHVIGAEAESVMLQTGLTPLRLTFSSSIVPALANTQLSTSSAPLVPEDSKASAVAPSIPALPVASPMVTNDLNTAEERTKPVTQVMARRDPYMNAKRINDSIFAFPASGSEISMEHRNSFAVIAHELRQNIEAHLIPVPAEPRIDIDLLMAGSCKADAKPSIVVTCDKKILSHLEATICVEHIQNQHNLVILKKSSWRNSWKW